jgi:hypothetical protein
MAREMAILVRPVRSNSIRRVNPQCSSSQHQFVEEWLGSTQFDELECCDQLYVGRFKMLLWLSYDEPWFRSRGEQAVGPPAQPARAR